MHIEPRTLRLPRRYKVIAPFLIVLMFLIGWLFFLTPARDYQLGTIGVAICVLLAIWSHVEVRNTVVRINEEGITVRNIFGARSARWSEVHHCSLHGSILKFHLTTGRPLKANINLVGFKYLLQILDDRGWR